MLAKVDREKGYKADLYKKMVDLMDNCQILDLRNKTWQSQEIRKISSFDQEPPCSTKEHHHRSAGGQRGGVQGGPLGVGGGPYESGKILDLRNKTLESVYWVWWALDPTFQAGI